MSESMKLRIREFFHPEEKAARLIYERVLEKILNKDYADLPVDVVDQPPVWLQEHQTWSFETIIPLFEGQKAIFREGRGGMRNDMGIITGKVGDVPNDQGLWIYAVDFDREWGEDN